jgi:hypothetical protein
MALLPDVGDALRHSRAEQAADVEEVDVDEDGRNAKLANLVSTS